MVLIWQLATGGAVGRPCGETCRTDPKTRLHWPPVAAFNFRAAPGLERLRQVEVQAAFAVDFSGAFHVV